MAYYLVLTADTPISADIIAAIQTYSAAPVERLCINTAHGDMYGDSVQVAIPTDAGIDLDRLRQRFEGVDFNIVPATRRQKKLLIADMDSTIIPVECIDEIADLAGVKKQVSLITEQAMQGELNFEEALIARVQLLKDIDVASLDNLYRTRITLNPGARTLVQTMNANGARTALVSGGFTFFSSRVAKDAGFSAHQANILDAKNNKLTGNVTYPILGQQAKLTALKDFIKQDGLSNNDVLAVGDGANDLMMIQHAGMGVAYRAKAMVAQQAAHVITNKNLCALLYLQGYKSTAFSHL